MAKPYNHLVTKREVLQATAKIFDPLGFISPVVDQAKIFLQALWQHKVGWDEPLTDDLCKEWTEIASDLNVQNFLSRGATFQLLPPNLHSTALLMQVRRLTELSSLLLTKTKSHLS